MRVSREGAVGPETQVLRRRGWRLEEGARSWGAKEKKRGKGRYVERGCGAAGREKSHMCI